MNILIHPWSSKLRDGRRNPKNYNQWDELVRLLMEEHHIIQVGVDNEVVLTTEFHKNQPMDKIKELIKECDLWISVDSFLPHLAQLVGKSGVVLWSVSDPLIFGYPENINILKDRKYLRENQFNDWHSASCNDDAWFSASEIFKILKETKKI